MKFASKLKILAVVLAMGTATLVAPAQAGVVGSIKGAAKSVGGAVKKAAGGVAKVTTIAAKKVGGVVAKYPPVKAVRDVGKVVRVIVR